MCTHYGAVDGGVMSENAGNPVYRYSITVAVLMQSFYRSPMYFSTAMNFLQAREATINFPERQRVRVLVGTWDLYCVLYHGRGQSRFG